MITETWTGCYEEGWGEYLTDQAFAHPAKFACGLIQRIFDEMIIRGMLSKGDVVVDPFGGVGCGGIIAASKGLRWIGCELEEKFYNLAQDNFAIHQNTWDRFGDHQPVMVHGDSRKLRGNLEGVLAIAVISSPPYSECLQGDNSARETAEESRSKRLTAGGSLGQSARHSGYGGKDNLGNLDAGSVEAVITSPPYTRDALGHAGGEGPRTTNAKNSKPGTPNSQVYGSGAGNLGNLKPGEVASIVTSPPYEGSDQNYAEGLNRIDKSKCVHGGAGFVRISDAKYGDSDGQIGNTSGETFWSAASDIVAECFAILKPGGWAVFVCKDFVRNKARVPFSDDWRKLCEHHGFVLDLWVKSSMLKTESHPGLFDDAEVVKTKSRKSFFRRLYERKYPENSIDEEDCLFFRKPGSP